MDERFEVKNITVDRAAGVTVTFGDDHVGTYDLVELRVHCPCAGCRGDRERAQAAWPKSTSPLPLAIEGAELVGAWGISFIWNDQHRAGIYPFTSLRQWSDDGQPPLNPDSGLRA